MDNKENTSTSEGEIGKDTKPKEKSSNQKGKSKKSIKRKVPVTIWVAIIGSFTTIVVALPSLLPLIPWPRLDPTPIFTPTSSPTPFITDAQAPFMTDTPTHIVLPSPTATPAITVTPIDTATIQPSPSPKMEVYLYANKTTGGPPLKVKFDARDSFLRESNGIQLSCRTGPCYYTWRVYSNGQQLGDSENTSSGRFEYTFVRRGTYSVTVHICRGRDRVDCGGSGILIVVT